MWVQHFTNQATIPPQFLTADGVKDGCLILSADTILGEDSSPTKYLMSGEMGVRKAASTVPHDIGDPGNELFVTCVNCVVPFLCQVSTEKCIGFDVKGKVRYNSFMVYG